MCWPWISWIMIRCFWWGWCCWGQAWTRRLQEIDRGDSRVNSEEVSDDIMHANYDNDVRTSVIIGGYTADTETQWFFDQFMFSHLILVIKILNDPLIEWFILQYLLIWLSLKRRRSNQRWWLQQGGKGLYLKKNLG